MPTPTGKLGCVVVAVDGSEESMNALKWALENLRLRSEEEGEPSGSFIVLHVQSPPSIIAGISPASIPFGGPSHVEVPAFSAAIEAHQKRITEAVLSRALQICAEKNVEVKTEVVVGEPKDMICDFTANVKADLLVMGCRAHGAIKRASHGVWRRSYYTQRYLHKWRSYFRLPSGHTLEQSYRCTKTHPSHLPLKLETKKITSMEPERKYCDQG